MLGKIRRCTPEKLELLVVDNDSTDGTVAYLKTQMDMTLICNQENWGFPKDVKHTPESLKKQWMYALLPLLVFQSRKRMKAISTSNRSEIEKRQLMAYITVMVNTKRWKRR